MMKARGLDSKRSYFLLKMSVNILFFSHKSVKVKATLSYSITNSRLSEIVVREAVKLQKPLSQYNFILYCAIFIATTFMEWDMNETREV